MKEVFEDFLQNCEDLDREIEIVHHNFLEKVGAYKVDKERWCTRFQVAAFLFHTLGGARGSVDMMMQLLVTLNAKVLSSPIPVEGCAQNIPFKIFRLLIFISFNFGIVLVDSEIRALGEVDWKSYSSEDHLLVLQAARSIISRVLITAIPYFQEGKPGKRLFEQIRQKLSAAAPGILSKPQAD